MSGVSITRRVRKGGVSYVVRYRTGGRLARVRHAGSFRTLREANLRKLCIAGEIAAGRDPADALRALVNPPQIRTFSECAEKYVASSTHLTQGTQKQLRSALRRLLPVFGDHDPHAITVADVRDWLSTMSELSGHTVRQYASALRNILDYADVEPNPARDRRVKLPRKVKKEPELPAADDVLASLATMPTRLRLPIIVLEQTAMRPSELATLTWADVDVAGARFRLRARLTKTRRSRWVPVPTWLMQELLDRDPQNGTAEDLVFPGCARERAGYYLVKACRSAGIKKYTLYTLRHRRLSLWHKSGIPAREFSDLAGHSQTSITLDVYSHVVLTDREIAVDEFLAVLRAPDLPRAIVRRRATKVRSHNARRGSNARKVEPKLGKRAERRYCDLEHILGKVRAEEILAQATEKARAKADKVIRIAYLFEAEGVEMPTHALSHYRRKDVAPGTFER